MTSRSPSNARIGRRPLALEPGEKVKDYPQLSIRLPVDVKPSCTRSA